MTPRPVRLLLGSLAAPAVGAAAAVGCAWLTPHPAGFLGVGLLVAVAIAGVGVRWVARGLVRDERRRWLRVAAGVQGLVLAVVAAAIAVPSPEPGMPAQQVAGERYWDLPSGSRVRYVEMRPRRQSRETPVVFVHGGPGTPDMAGDAEYFGRLAGDGFDVYVYDAVGSGRSTRLAPRQYSRDRDVGDLEAIRRRIGARRLVLVGHSYGATVVAAYLAAHPGRVDRAVLLSPGPLDPADTSGSGVRGRLDSGTRTRLYARLLRPRNLFLYALLQVDPDAAYALVGDAEADAQNDRVYATSEPALHCGGHGRRHPPTGLGFYRLHYPQSAIAPPERDPRPLAGDRTPTLVVKGSCDYLSWHSAVEYGTTLADARLVYVRGGHNVYQDAPAQVLATMRASLDGRALPERAYRSDTAPADYQGPP